MDILPLSDLKSAAEFYMGIHDNLPRPWRDLSNEYGERAIQFYHLGAPLAFAIIALKAEREVSLH